MRGDEHGPSASKLHARVAALAEQDRRDAKAARPTGMLTKKIHSQESASVSTPPRRDDGGAEAADRAPDAERDVPLPALRERRHQDRQRRRGDRRGAEP